MAGILWYRIPPTLTHYHMKGTGLLRAAIKQHGGSYEAFASEVLGRSRSSVWRWLRGTHAIPASVIARLRSYLTVPSTGDAPE